MKDVFDYLDRMLDSYGSAPSFPPYNIIADAEGNLDYLEVAAAGYDREDIAVDRVGNVLVIQGGHAPDDRKYLYHGIARRKFELRFKVYPQVEVSKVTMKDGLLRVVFKLLEPPDHKRGYKIE